MGRRNSFTVTPDEGVIQPKADEEVEVDVGDWFDAQAVDRSPAEQSFCRRNLRTFVVVGFVVIGLTVGLSLSLTGSANPAAFFVQEDPPGQTEVNPWRVRLKTGLRMQVLNALEDRWTPAFDQYVQEWDNGEPDSLILTSRKVARDIECSPVDGQIKVCNGDYGRTDWRGINIMLTMNGFAVNSAAKLNDYHLDKESEAQSLYTMCHEIGHALGLPHTDENYYNRNRGDCLDYTLRPEGNLRPGTHNFELLSQVYGIVGSSPTPPSGSPSDPGSSQTPARDEEEQNEEDRAIRRLGDPSKTLPCDMEDELLVSLDPVPSFIMESYSSVVAKLEGMSCGELHLEQSDRNVRLLHEHEHGEACEVELGYDGFNTFSLHVNKLRVA